MDTRHTSIPGPSTQIKHEQEALITAAAKKRGVQRFRSSAFTSHPTLGLKSFCTTSGHPQWHALFGWEQPIDWVTANDAVRNAAGCNEHRQFVALKQTKLLGGKYCLSHLVLMFRHNCRTPCLQKSSSSCRWVTCAMHFHSFEWVHASLSCPSVLYLDS